MFQCNCFFANVDSGCGFAGDVSAESRDTANLLMYKPSLISLVLRNEVGIEKLTLY